MNKFLMSVLGFSCLVLLPFVIELFILPNHFFSFRIYEGINVSRHHKGSFYGPFYPNKQEEKMEVGDLGHHTSYGIEKKAVWITDDIGYRNKKYINSPSVLFIGQSNSYGSSLSQDDIISEQFTRATDLSSYNIGPANINTYLKMNKQGVLEKPNAIVLLSMERALLRLPVIRPNIKYPAKESSYNLKYLELYDRFKKQNMKSFVKARLNNKKGFGRISAVKNDKFLVAQGLTWKMPAKNLDKVINIVRAYDKYCKKMGIKFIFVPLPNRETIFFDSVPWETQPNFLSLLKKELDKNDIENIDVLSLFNKKRDEGVMMYQYDDTHWNKTGVELVVKELKKILN